MNKLLVAIGTGMLALIMVTPSASATQPGLNRDDFFWLKLTSFEPSWDYISNKEEAISLAKQLCKKMKKRSDVSDLRTAFEITGFTTKQSGTFFRTATDSYCKKKNKWVLYY